MGTVQHLAAADEEAAIALWNETGLARPWNDAGADFRRALAGPSSTLLGVREGGRLIGTAMVGDDGHRGWVYYLAVSPTVQRSGVGRALMAAAETWLRERGAVKIQFMVRTDNEAAQGFYDHLGYPVQDVVTRGRRLDGENQPTRRLPADAPNT